MVQFIGEKNVTKVSIIHFENVFEIFYHIFKIYLKPVISS